MRKICLVTVAATVAVVTVSSLQLISDVVLPLY